MKAYVITLEGNPYSEQAAERCINSARENGLTVEKFPAVAADSAERVMMENNLSWTWADGNTREMICPQTQLRHFPYRTRDFKAKIGCSMSHYLLWQRCINLGEPVLILEHDAVFVRAFPVGIEFQGICQINDPSGATVRGSQWSRSMKQRGGSGVFEKTWVRAEHERDIPDGLAGNSAYLVKPWAARELVRAFQVFGVWPNDATICKQLFPYLEEYYPFITVVKQTQSTTT